MSVEHFRNEIVTLLSANEFATVNGVANTPIGVPFGAPQDNEFFTLDANGLMTSKVTDAINVHASFHPGRVSAPGPITVAFLYPSFNGVPMDNNAIGFDTTVFAWPVEVIFSMNINAGDTIQFFLVLDSIGGGVVSLFPVTPTNPSIPPAPSAKIAINRAN